MWQIKRFFALCLLGRLPDGGPVRFPRHSAFAGGGARDPVPYTTSAVCLFKTLRALRFQQLLDCLRRALHSILELVPAISIVQCH